MAFLHLVHAPAMLYSDGVGIYPFVGGFGPVLIVSMPLRLAPAGRFGGVVRALKETTQSVELLSMTICYKMAFA